jgi:hypothetical protein
MIPLLQKIKIGETINISTMTIENYHHPFTSMKRWFYNENRFKMLTEVEATVSNHVKQPEVLKSCIPGLKNLMITYGEDEVCKYRLIKCVKLIECYQKVLQQGITSTQQINELYRSMLKDTVVPKGYKQKDKWIELAIAGIQAVSDHLSKMENRKRLVKDIGPYVVQNIFFPGYNHFLFLFSLKMILGKAHKLIEH